MVRMPVKMSLWTKLHGKVQNLWNIPRIVSANLGKRPMLKHYMNPYTVTQRTGSISLILEALPNQKNNNDDLVNFNTHVFNVNSNIVVV